MTPRYPLALLRIYERVLCIEFTFSFYGLDFLVYEYIRTWWCSLFSYPLWLDFFILLPLYICRYSMNNLICDWNVLIVLIPLDNKVSWKSHSFSLNKLLFRFSLTFCDKNIIISLPIWRQTLLHLVLVSRFFTSSEIRCAEANGNDRKIWKMIEKALRDFLENRRIWCLWRRSFGVSHFVTFIRFS